MRHLVFTLCLALTATLAAQGVPLGGPAPAITLQNCARINNADSQFGPALYRDQLVYVTRPKRGKVNPGTRQTYYTLYAARLAPDGTPDFPKRFSVELTSNYNEGPVSFTYEEDRLIYFTRTQLDEGATVEDAEGRANLGIFSAFRAEYDWAAVRPLPFNGPDFSNQHPALDEEGTRIYFSSNRPNGFGGYDLYFSDYGETGWGPAINLGPEINTQDNEAFPFIHPSGRLIFSSNGHGEGSDYDLYLIDLGQRRWGKLTPLPEPLNSGGDDIGMVLTDDGRRGYLASNRRGGEGKDDIYLVNLRDGLNSLQGPSRDDEPLTVFNGANSTRVAGAEVYLYEVDDAGRLPAEAYTLRAEDGELVPVPRPVGELSRSPGRSDSQGQFRLRLMAGRQYEAVVAKPGFRTERLRFAYGAEGPSRPLVVTLRPSGCRLISGTIGSIEGGVVAGARLRMRPQGCAGEALTAVTDEYGFFEACAQEDCDYIIKVEAVGFRGANASLASRQLVTFAHPRVELKLARQVNTSLQPRAGAVPLSFGLRGLRFAAGTSVPEQTGDAAVALLADFLESRPEARVQLNGYAENPLTAARRAEVVRQTLVSGGVAEARIRTAGLDPRVSPPRCGNCAVEAILEF